MVSYHAGLSSPKNEIELVDNMHLMSKRLMYQSSILKHLLNDFKKFSKKIQKNKVSKDEIEARLEILLKKIESIFLMEEKEQDIEVKYGATAQIDELKKIKQVADEINKLVANISIPSDIALEVKEQVYTKLKEIRKKINSQAVIAMEVSRGSYSITLQTKGAFRSDRRVAIGEKKSAHKAGDLIRNVNKIHEDLMENERLHNIDKIKVDLIGELEGDEKIINFIHTDILFCLLFMQRIKEHINELKDFVKGIGNAKRLGDLFKRIEGEWKIFIDDVSKVLQQLRFSVMPEEMSETQLAA